VPCGQSRETVKRSELAGHAAYGWCAAHSRYFWGFRLYLLCAPDAMRSHLRSRPRTSPSGRWPRPCSSARRGELLQGGELIVGDKGFAGEEFEQIVASLDAELIRPDRRDERPRFGSLGGLRQWIESVIDTLKGQFSLERHGGHTVEGVWVRVCQRVLALAAGCRHNWEIGKPGRGFTAYDH
jgi:hypothetical protein